MAMASVVCASRLIEQKNTDIIIVMFNLFESMIFVYSYEFS
jgi:hypothetical protein